jgi:outer membrane protein assembly factor BamB
LNIAGPEIAEMPQEFIPSARSRSLVAAGPPQRPSLGSVPLGPIELNDPSKRGVKGHGMSRRMAVLVMAGVLVVVVALGAVAAIWLLGGRGAEAEELAPDIKTKPELGKVLGAGAANAEGYDWAEFMLISAGPTTSPSVLLNATTALIYAGGEGKSLITAVNTADGATKWHLDLVELTGQATVRLKDVWRSNDGGAIIGLEYDLSTGVVMAVSAKGEVRSQRQDASLLGAGGGLVAMNQGDHVVVAPASDLTQDKWTGDGWPDCIEPVLTDSDGSLWICASEGFIDAATGQEVGFGQDITDPDVFYFLHDGVLIRLTSAQWSIEGSLMRVDPKTGDNLWEKTLTFAGAAVPVHGGDWVFAAVDGSVHCIDPKSGQVRWTRPADWFIGVVGSTAFVASNDGQVSALKANTGGLRYQFRIDPFDAQLAELKLGPNTLYQVNGDTLAAYPLVKDAQRLWTVDLPPMNEPSLSHVLYLDGGKLWVASDGNLRQIV